jgi:hypothetical protein
MTSRVRSRHLQRRRQWRGEWKQPLFSVLRSLSTNPQRATIEIDIAHAQREQLAAAAAGRQCDTKDQASPSALRDRDGTFVVDRVLYCAKRYAGHRIEGHQVRRLLVSSFLIFVAIAGCPVGTHVACPGCIERDRDNSRCG